MAKAIKASGKVGPRSGFVKATFSLLPEQLAAVVTEAQDRAQERGVVRADASEVVREALEAWSKQKR
ncbi:MAG: hypothetical protein QM767_11600 [Anaeromyxobacter sp.]